MGGNRKVIKETEMMEMLREGRVSLPPLVIRFLKDQPETWFGRYLDALVEVSWGKQAVKFMVEMKSQSTPKVFQDAVGIVKAAIAKERSNRLPMVMLPYLSDAQLRELEQEGISGIDLCGNGVVTVPGGFSVFRAGKPNRFSSSAPIKNIYQKNSSMVGRVFLVRSQFEAVKDVVNEVRQRSLLVTRWQKSPLTFATVSKAIAGLEEDLIIGRSEGRIRLLQADKLLDKLSQSYAPPKTRERLRVKVESSGSTLLEFLMRQSEQLKLPIVATGASSVGQYAVMQRGEMLSVYCPRLGTLLQQLPARPDDRFPNLELIETEDDRLYFDAREERGFCWASPVQVYLELMAGDKRDQETAVQVRDRILRDAEAQRP